MREAGIDASVEEILLRADRRVLRSLSQRARCMILILRILQTTGKAAREDLRAYIESYGFRCGRLDEIVDMLSFYGVVECNEYCKLTDVGEDLAAALQEFLESLRSLAYNVVEGVASENDVVASLVTVFASTLGFIDVYVEEPSLAPIYIPIHLYVSGLSTVVLAQLARVSVQVYDVVKRFLEEPVG
ncbi:hypothetical protein [Hyperthermus butylicus]|uniref:Uncharacterized protein n=1 Tax=Hyperthermus butylicus (strain DSM 5456 / JCM 9403 / PLM1-5) TaxID=415426 RepID=A2BM08_HYPBU|nr:hypothetical protein [Hyperthermus butylicus]ABM81019.1 hypothetical protein Hbut_1185 [Hyperthermus butylicus DSM 5456]